MARLRYRYLLPLGHMLVDVILLGHFIWVGHRSLRGACDAPAKEAAVGWNRGRVFDVQPWEFTFLASGTAPAGLISHAARPDADVQNCYHLWDPVWFSIHESVALLFWFLVGTWQDSPTARHRKLLGVYLGFRFVSAALCWTVAMASLGSRVQILFWYVFCICALVLGVGWLLHRLRPRP